MFEGLEAALARVSCKSLEEYRQTPWWLEISLVMREVIGTCTFEECGEEEGLHVHHDHYLTLGAEAPEDLSVLCGKHHEERHLVIKGLEEIEDSGYVTWHLAVWSKQAEWVFSDSRGTGRYWYPRDGRQAIYPWALLPGQMPPAPVPRDDVDLEELESPGEPPSSLNQPKKITLARARAMSAVRVHRERAGGSAAEQARLDLARPRFAGIRRDLPSCLPVREDTGCWNCKHGISTRNCVWDSACWGGLICWNCGRCLCDHPDYEYLRA